MCAGDQAEIVFTLIGEPPFTFTYQRSEPTPKKGGKPGRVLETHTVSRVMTHEYSIFSALEGTRTFAKRLITTSSLTCLPFQVPGQSPPFPTNIAGILLSSLNSE